jgi:hypothetical protein
VPPAPASGIWVPRPVRAGSWESTAGRCPGRASASTVRKSTHAGCWRERRSGTQEGGPATAFTNNIALCDSCAGSRISFRFASLVRDTGVLFTSPHVSPRAGCRRRSRSGSRTRRRTWQGASRRWRGAAPPLTCPLMAQSGLSASSAYLSAFGVNRTSGEAAACFGPTLMTRSGHPGGFRNGW